MRDRILRTFLFVLPAVIAVAFGVGMSRLSAQTLQIAAGGTGWSRSDEGARVQEMPRYLLVLKAYRWCPEACPTSSDGLTVTLQACGRNVEDGLSISYHRSPSQAVQQLKTWNTSKEDFVGLFEVGREINLKHKQTRRKAPDVITEGVETTYEEWSTP